jgi:RHS repeat-associated protein
MLTQTVANTGGSPANLVTTMVRDPRGLVTSQTDPAGIVTTSTYDNHDQLVSTIGMARTTWVNAVSTAGVTPTVTIGRDTFDDPTDQLDANGNLTHGTFDALGRNRTVTLPAYTPPGGSPITATSSTDYNTTGTVSQRTDALGNVTTYTYNPYGDLLTTTAPDPDGAGPLTAPVTTNTYDRDHEELSTTDPTGAQYLATYTYLGQTATSSVSDRETGSTLYFTTTYGYDTAGNQTSSQDPLTNTTTATYDTAGDVTKTTLPSGRFTQTTYDLAGRTTSTVQGKGSNWGKTIQTYAYDLAGRQTSETDCTVTSTGTCSTAQRTITTSYDGDNHVLQTTSGAGRLTINGYDTAGQLSTVTQRTDPTNPATAITVQLGYDAEGHQTRMVDGNGNATTYTFTPWGEPESTIEPSTPSNPSAADRTWTTSYNADGQSVQDTIPGSVSRTRTFDNDGRLTDETGTGAATTTVAHHFGYDADGRLTLQTSPAGNTTYTYNDRGLITGSTAPGSTAAYVYNADGQITSRTDPTGTATFTYNIDGAPQTVADPLTGVTATYTYGTAALQSITFGTGGPSENLTYDNLSRVATNTWQNPSGTTLASTTYGYDNDDNVTSKNTTGLTGAGTNSYVYDGLNRLTSWTNPSSAVTTYGYDNASNRTTVTTAAGTRTTVYDARNRATSATGAGIAAESWTWTPRGTLISDAGATTTTYTSDAFDRIITSTANTITQTYTYDSLDRVATSNGTAFTYDDKTNNPASVPDPSSGTDLIFRDTAGAPLSEKAGTGSAQLLLSDTVHGDAEAAASPTTGAVTASASYDPYGQITAHTGTLPLGYQAGWTDPTTGNVNATARWYNPTTGSFISRDSMLLAPSPVAQTNRYAYGNDDPETNNDPSGHASTSTIGDIANYAADFDLWEAEFDVTPVGWVTDEVAVPVELIQNAVTWAGIGIACIWMCGGSSKPTPIPKPKDLTGDCADGACSDFQACESLSWCVPGVEAPTCISTSWCGPTGGRDTGRGGGGRGHCTGNGCTPICLSHCGTTRRSTPRPPALPGNTLPSVISMLAAGVAIGNTLINTVVDQPDENDGGEPGPIALPAPTDTSTRQTQQDCMNGTWTGPVVYNTPLASDIETSSGVAYEHATGGFACYNGSVTNGSPAKDSVSPYGRTSGMARGHLIADILNGSGEDLENLVPLYAGPNRAMESDIEIPLRNKINAGAKVYYSVIPLFSPGDPIPWRLNIDIVVNGDPYDCYIINEPNMAATTPGGRSIPGSTCDTFK